MIYTIGHSTHSMDEFVNLLKTYKIEKVIDIRTIPKSRHNPQFNEADLKKSLKSQGIGYLWLKELGGLRHSKRDSINTGWRNLSFRGYADYMQTPEFHESLKELINMSKTEQIVIMCAEAVPWRCHRSLVGDALLVQGIEVKDIFNEKNCKSHSLTSFAKVEDNQITYPGDLHV